MPKFVQTQAKNLGVTTDNFKQKWDDYAANPNKAPQQMKAFMKKVFTHMKKWYGKGKGAVVEYLKSPKIGLGIEVVGETPAVEGAPALTPQEKQQEFFKDTKVVDDQGSPKAVYHATATKFETFDTKGLGSHFGTKEQAGDRIDRGSVPREGRQVIPVYLNIKNPLRLDEPIFGDWENGNEIKRQLEEKGLKSVPKEPKVKRGVDYYPSTGKTRRQHLVDIKRYLMDQGYDGIVYQNEFEGEQTPVAKRKSLESPDVFQEEHDILIGGEKNRHISRTIFR